MQALLSKVRNDPVLAFGVLVAVVAGLASSVMWSIPTSGPRHLTKHEANVECQFAGSTGAEDETYSTEKSGRVYYYPCANSGSRVNAYQY